MRRTTTWMLLCCLLVAHHIEETTQLTITNVTIPSLVKSGDADHIILDCDYDLGDTPNTGLVVKWFMNENDLTYQWILGSEPKAIAPVEKYIDLRYKASDDPDTMYRAMKLNKPGIDLTGEYKCVISTFADEKASTKTMVVYSTEDKFELMHRKKSEDNLDSVEVTCIAEGLYPRPTLDISVEGLLQGSLEQNTEVLQVKDGRFRVLTRLQLKDEDVPNPAVLKCVLSVPDAEYSVSRESVYYPGPPTTTPTTTTMLLPKLDIQAPDNSQPDNGGGSAAGIASAGIFFLIAELVTVAAFVF